MPMRRKSTEEDTSQLDKSEDECGDSGTRDSNDDSVYVCVCARARTSKASYKKKTLLKRKGIRKKGRGSIP